MPSIRELRSRIRSVNSTKKITKAQELIATSRITKAQARVAASRPYAEKITEVLTALANGSASLSHPLLTERPEPKRAGVLVVTSDRGMCGGYNSNVLKEAEALYSLLRQQGKTPVVFVLGQKGVGYYRFRHREVAGSWTGFSQQPDYDDAARASEYLVDLFLAGSGNEVSSPDGSATIEGVDELHIVYTQFVSMLTQRPKARRLAPLEVEYSDEDEIANSPSAKAGEGAVSSHILGDTTEYEFEPEADVLLASLLPKYLSSRVYAALLDSAAAESAARRTAMKAATDNASELAKTLTRQANQLRQAQITQEISEIVGGAGALSASAGRG
ncbi:ATP synthase F1, gamma subunit [Segniliparus rotundus DSM 44985]|uniref:ATP synthase gamma chain n=1 Tax=Segniliparus rotundus (strain ATCC BAA-972 / CDC 1076 / CIP 108378 / DSM 44985 / JCM 13578) TaxID=640132 RepID=D6ZDB7_SEGRD|nr:F0F1 ATP synthase subunit gamma [Segniliparus rotundus]ADG97181.1 ATP synthase F1, gamma subunit [Segniliparus rotundus DSM 44985]